MAYANTILCADSDSVRFPATLGLEGEDLGAQSWLSVFTSGCEARSYLKEALAARRGAAQVSQVWVASSDDVDSINIAAAFKRDWPLLKVCLIAFDCTGSLASRANLAGIDEVLGNADFCARYGEEKRRHRARVGGGGAGRRGGSAFRKAAQSPRSSDGAGAAAIPSAAPAAPATSDAGSLQNRPDSLPAGMVSIAHIVLGGQGAALPASGFGSLDGDRRDSYPTELLTPAASARATGTPASRGLAPGAAAFPAVPLASSPDAACKALAIAPVPVPASPASSPAASAALPASQPLSPSRVASSLSCPASLRSGLERLPRGGKRAYLLPVLSGSGGAGKSTVAALSAILSARGGYETLLLDLDLQFGDEDVLLGVPDALRLDDALDDPAKLVSVRADGSHPALVAALRRFERAEEAAQALPAMLDVLRTHFDVIVANTGGFWAEQHAVLLERSSKALFLVDQRPSSLRACRRAVDLCGRCGIATGPLLFAANRCTKGSLYSSIDISCSLRGSFAVELKDGGREVEDLVSAGHPYDLLDTGNALAESLGAVLDDILPVRPQRAGTTAPASQGGSPAGRNGNAASKSRSRNPFRSGKRKDASCLG